MKPIDIRDKILRAALPNARLVDRELLSPGRRLHLSDSPVCGAVAWVTIDGVKSCRIQVATNGITYIQTWIPSSEEGSSARLDRSVSMQVETSEAIADACATTELLWDSCRESWRKIESGLD